MALADQLSELTRRDLCGIWQGRALLHPSCGCRLENGYLHTGQLGMSVLSVLAHGWDRDPLVILLMACFPGFVSITTPFLAERPRIYKNGTVVCEKVVLHGAHYEKRVLFRSERRMEYAFRKLADACKFNDSDRLHLIMAVRNWIGADFRLDPTMAAADPDAKRLVVS